MRKLFVQFFLLLFVCFLVMAMLVGLVYKVTAERAGRQSMDDLMKSSLYLMRSELREIPLKDWNKTIATLDLNLSFKLHIEPLGKQELSEDLKNGCGWGNHRPRRSVHLYAAHSAQPLRVGGRPHSLSVLSASDAPAGSGVAGVYRHVAGAAGVPVDAAALARPARWKTPPSASAPGIWMSVPTSIPPPA